MLCSTLLDFLNLAFPSIRSVEFSVASEIASASPSICDLLLGCSGMGRGGTSKINSDSTGESASLSEG